MNPVLKYLWAQPSGMDLLIPAVAVLILAAWLVRPDLPGLRGTALVRALLLGGLSAFVTLYFVMPPLTPVVIALLFGLNLAASQVVGLLLERKTGFARGLAVGALILVGVGLLALVAVPLGAPDLAALLPVNESSETATVISTGHIRQVSAETALWRADKPVGRIGYKAGTEEVHVQQLDGSIAWLCPLDFTDPYKALVYGDEGTGGYVLVPAEDPYAEARFVSADLRYTPNAVFGHDLFRSIYFESPGVIIREPVFQVGTGPAWVAQLTSPSVLGVTGDVPVGIAVVDAVMGTVKVYPTDGVPDWVQRPYDEALVEDYLGWWGAYRGGWVNSWLGQRDVLHPTGGLTTSAGEDGRVRVEAAGTDVYLVVGADGRQYWFSPLTSAGRDFSMVGYMLVDARDGSAVFHRHDGIYNDLGAAQNVQQDPEVSKVMGLRVVQPIMYVIGGEEVWVVPVIAPSGEMKAVGLVRARGGTTFVSSTLEGALARIGEVAPAPGAGDPAAVIAELRGLVARLGERIDALESALNQTPGS